MSEAAEAARARLDASIKEMEADVARQKAAILPNLIGRLLGILCACYFAWRLTERWEASMLALLLMTRRN